MIWPESFETKSGFSRIRELAMSYCLSEPGKELLSAMGLLTDPVAINLRLQQAEEMRIILNESLPFPLGRFYGLDHLLNKAKIEGSFLEEDEVAALGQSLETTRAVLSFLRSDTGSRFTALSELAAPVKHYPAITAEVQKILGKDGRIRDNASRELQNIRRGIAAARSQVTRTILNILHRAQSEGWAEPGAEVALRGGRPVIPVASTFKRRIPGYIHDESSTGRTSFVEPAEVVEAGNRLRELELAERREIVRILIEFTSFIRPYIPELLVSHDFLAALDTCRARALLAISIGGIMPVVQDKPGILWDKAVHPLLLLSLREAGRERELVPLDIVLNEKDRILLISGPNAGGKSVCLKTVALLQYMFQCGYLVPVKEGSRFGIFEDFFIDIGDEQSIENDLSTYSSHLQSMKHFLRHSGKASLILIDEFGTGTEPSIGGAIAEAVLEALNNTGAYGVITTHYTNLKHFAASSEGITNGAMLFDTEKIRPLFRLAMGRPGSSFAFEIARKTGLPEEILRRAGEKAGKENVDFDKHLRDILRDRKYWEQKRDMIRINEKRLTAVLEKYEKELGEAQQTRKKILGDAKLKADQILDGANRQIENTIREIREAEAEKNRTREARRKLEEYRKELEIAAGEADDLLNKIESLKKKKERHPEPTKILKKSPAEKISNPEVGKGDYVLLNGQETPGLVLEIRGAKCLVAFGNIQTRVKTSELSKIPAQEYRDRTRNSFTNLSAGEWDIGKRALVFTPDIDLRGKRAEEAIQILQSFIDEAVMVRRTDLRILHGKGNGILRELIRQQLKAHNLVEWFADEHVERGGSGITLVKLSL